MDRLPLINSQRALSEFGLIHSGESLGGKFYAICGPVFTMNIMLHADIAWAERTLEPVTCLRCLVRELHG